MKIYTKLLLLNFFYVLSLVVVLGVNIWNSHYLLKENHEIWDNSYAKIEISNMIQKSLLGMQSLIGSLFQANRLNQVTVLEERLLLMFDDVNHYIDTLSEGGTAEYILRSNNMVLQKVEFTPDNFDIDVKLEYYEIKMAVEEIQANIENLVKTIEERQDYIDSGQLTRVESLNQQIQKINLRMSPVFVRALERANEVYIEAVNEQEEALLSLSTANNHSLILKITLASIIIISGSLVAFLIVRKIVQPLRRVTQRIQQLANRGGDLSVRLPIITKDEIAELSKGFNDFTSDLTEIVRDIRSASHNLSETSVELSGNMEESSTILKDVASAIDKIRIQNTTQIEQTKKTISNLEDVQEAIEELNRSMDKQVVVVDNSSSVISNLVTNIHQLSEELEEHTSSIKDHLDLSRAGKDNIDQLTEGIRNLEDISREMLKFNTAIEDISDQTNLLSINAAIEAAHTGELGKGFAVVAGEIRNLANQSSRQSNESTRGLSAIKASIDSLAEVSRHSAKALDQTIRGIKFILHDQQDIKEKLLKQVKNTNQVLETMDQLKKITGVVKIQAEKMSQKKNDISREIKKMTELNTQMTAAVSLIGKNTGQIESFVDEMTKTSTTNKHQIELLNKLIAGFQTG